MENNVDNNKYYGNKLPWQISTAGMVLGFFMGFACLLIALVGNHQYKQGKDVKELISAYNIIFIISIIALVLVFVIFIIFIVAAVANGNNYVYYD
ncbi:MAG: hypothetical protein LBT75_04460 [Bacilli bacterium]|jgi:Na+/proline symporter|nr:hypothetical protein [Bacilli bacterium]